jgi:hypothetical protein
MAVRDMNNENYMLCQEYPFLIPRNAITDEIEEDYDYSFTYLDECPKGWQELFLDMCAHIKPMLEESGQLNNFRFVQIKEKYGRLVIYHAGAPVDVDNVISFYEDVSRTICIGCGNPATKITKGWIMPVCDSCADEHGIDGVDINEWFKGLEEAYE